MIERVNGIFGPVDWGLDITGHRLVDIGFTIKEIKILDRPDPRDFPETQRHFNAPAQKDIDEVPRAMMDSFSAEVKKFQIVNFFPKII